MPMLADLFLVVVASVAMLFVLILGGVSVDDALRNRSN
jgi:hypothetical protein